MKKRDQTSWEEVADGYDAIVAEKGHYYHQSVVLPHLLGHLKEQTFSLIDLGCGQGVLERALPSSSDYLGLDSAQSLIERASASRKSEKHRFLTCDVTKPFDLKEKFNYATFVLSLQNMAHPGIALKNARRHLEEKGKLLIILNHPCFRIPKQSSWGYDAQEKVQFRRLDRYLTHLKTPILHEPSRGTASSTTLSYHHSLSAYSKLLSDAGFSISLIEELISPKISEGGRAAAENLAREEFPLFLSLLCYRKF